MGSENLRAKDRHEILLMGSHRNLLVIRAMVDPLQAMAVLLVTHLGEVVVVPHLRHHLVDRLIHVDTVAVAVEVVLLYHHQDPFLPIRILLTPRRSL